MIKPSSLPDLILHHETKITTFQLLPHQYIFLSEKANILYNVCQSYPRSAWVMDLIKITYSSDSMETAANFINVLFRA